jgi:GNAT superfamily N-acetyltransferase
MIPDAELIERFGKPRDELIRITDQHTLEVQAWLSSRSPKAEKFEGRGVRASSTGFNIPLLNLALGCNFPKGISEQEVEAEIESVKGFFAKRDVPWYWWMNAKPSPANIRHLLEKRGLEYDAPPLPAMIAPTLQSKKSFPMYAEDILVWRAESIADLQAASRIRRTSFKFPDGEALTYFEDMRSDWLDESSRARLFLAGRSKFEPVSIGAVIEGAGIPGVYAMATLPDQHRKGYGKAILTRLLSEPLSSKSRIIALTASEAGFGLYSQFGFIHLFDFDFYSVQGRHNA